MKSILIILQPLEYFNSKKQTVFDHPEEYEVIAERLSWGENNAFVRYHGVVNYLLLFIFFLVRFVMLIQHLVWVKNNQNVKL